ncbi:MAG: winged helix-turn-helix transcriptional regulator [Bacteroidia bacterium]
MDELGSGVRNTFKYCGIYTPGTKPEFIEEDVFRTIIPLKGEDGTTQMTTQIISEKILDLLRQYPTMSRKKLAEVLGDITEDGVKYHLDKLKEEGKIERIGGTRGKWKINV